MHACEGWCLDWSVLCTRLLPCTPLSSCCLASGWCRWVRGLPGNNHGFHHATVPASLPCTAPHGLPPSLLTCPISHSLPAAPRRYQGLREPLLGTTHLLFCLFLSSLQPLQPAAGHAPALAAATCAALASTTAEVASGSCGPEGLAPGGEAVLAGFGILRFVVHSCGLHYLTLAPLLLRVSLGPRAGGCGATCWHAACWHGFPTAWRCMSQMRGCAPAGRRAASRCRPAAAAAGLAACRAAGRTLADPLTAHLPARQHPPAAAHPPRASSPVRLARPRAVPPA